MIGIRTYLVLTGVLCTVQVSLGQWGGSDAAKPKDHPAWLASYYLDWGIATRTFARNMTRDNGFGMGGELLYNIASGSPVWAGAGVHSFAFDTDRITYTQLFNGEFYNYSERTTSRAFMAHGVVRFQPPVRFEFQPYIQGSVGVHWFFTNTKIRDTDAGEIAERINEIQDAVLGFGLHGGLQYVPRRVPEIRADFRFGYFRNASVEYLRYNQRLDDGNGLPVDYFEQRVSAVDMFGMHVGVTFLIKPYRDIFGEKN